MANDDEPFGITVIKVILGFIGVILAAMLIKHILMGYLNSGTF